MSKQKQSSGMAIIVLGWWPGQMEWGEERGGGESTGCSDHVMTF